MIVAIMIIMMMLVSMILMISISDILGYNGEELFDDIDYSGYPIEI